MICRKVPKGTNFDDKSNEEIESGINGYPHCALDALAIDEPLEYACLALDGNLQMWVDAKEENS